MIEMNCNDLKFISFCFNEFRSCINKQTIVTKPDWPDRPDRFDQPTYTFVQEICAENDKCDGTGPKEPLKMGTLGELAGEYSGIDTKLEIEGLPTMFEYTHYRNVRGDGACFYRAVLNGFMYASLGSGDRSNLNSFIELVKNIFDKPTNNAYEKLFIDSCRKRQYDTFIDRLVFFSIDTDEDYNSYVKHVKSNPTFEFTFVYVFKIAIARILRPILKEKFVFDIPGVASSVYNVARAPIIQEIPKSDDINVTLAIEIYIAPQPENNIAPQPENNIDPQPKNNNRCTKDDIRLLYSKFQATEFDRASVFTVTEISKILRDSKIQEVLGKNRAVINEHKLQTFLLYIEYNLILQDYQKKNRITPYSEQLPIEENSRICLTDLHTTTIHEDTESGIRFFRNIMIKYDLEDYLKNDQGKLLVILTEIYRGDNLTRPLSIEFDRDLGMHIIKEIEETFDLYIEEYLAYHICGFSTFVTQNVIGMYHYWYPILKCNICIYRQGYFDFTYSTGSLQLYSALSDYIRSEVLPYKYFTGSTFYREITKVLDCGGKIQAPINKEDGLRSNLQKTLSLSNFNQHLSTFGIHVYYGGQNHYMVLFRKR
jgi:hypothetical protein